MSQLIALAQRIKVIQSIQKTAHAMQLISMSTLSRLKGQRAHVQRCMEELDEFLAYTSHPAGQAPLVVLIGSQKGFSGNFNQLVFDLFKRQGLPHITPIIPVGKLVDQFLRERGYRAVHTALGYSPTTLAAAAQSLTDRILSHSHIHDHVYVMSNVSHSIFLQKPLSTQLPLTSAYVLSDAYPMKQDMAIAQEELFKYYFFIKIYSLLLESLIAENSARTVSMESSTSNARTLLQKMKLDYNKLRQAKVTRELTELSSSLLET